MNSPLRENELVSILGIMEQMVVKAENSDWSSLSLLDKKRRSIILGGDSGKSEKANKADKYHHLSALERTSDNKPGQDNNKEPGITPCQSPHCVLVEKILEIDQYLNDTIKDARKSLLFQSRKHNEQIKAKKCYDMASDLA